MRITDTASLGALLRAERKRQGLRQVDLAAAIGVGVVFLSDLENGKATAEIGKVIQVIHGLSLNINIEKR